MGYERERSNYPNSRLKRGVDIAAGLVGLLPALAPMGIAAVAIKLADGGEVFFRQERIGKDGKPFVMYKLRTFNDEGNKTRVGLFIRPFAIDELPQIFNILRGDMSVFGIRALSQTDFDTVYTSHERFPEEITEELVENWKDRYVSARPGGLSLAVTRGKSIFFRGYTTAQEIHTKIEADIEQADNESFSMDIHILFMILRKALGGK